MRTTKLSELKILDRQRKEIKPSHIQELKKSILTKGLLHPVVCSKRDDELYLLAGECRSKAIKELYEEGLSFSCDGTPIALGSIPYILVGDLTPIQLLEAELEENVFRLPLTWMEDAEARAKIHKARQELNPKQTQTQTATEIAVKTGNAVSTEKNAITQALLVTANKDNPRLVKARSLKEAARIILDEQEASLKGELAKITASATSDLNVHQGDAFDLIKNVPNNLVSTILCDPPYGIAANQQGKDSKHFYDDSADYALNFCKMILREGFRVTKPQALLFMFCDIEHFITLREFAQQQAWTTWRTPLIWSKGNTGSAPWGRAGFIRTYETILFASKGQKELVYPGGLDILSSSRVSRSERVHAAEKPISLLRYLLYISTLQGETVLDPCCGSGNIILASRLHQADIIAFEKDPTYYNEAIQKLTTDLASWKEEAPEPKKVTDLEDL